MRIPFTAACLLLCAAFPGALSALGGQVVYSEGDVTVRSAAAEQPAATGDALGPGDIVRTGAKSLAVIDLANGITVKLREKTLLAIDSLGEDTAVSLKEGGAFASIVRKLVGHFSVRTGNTVAGVRGTRFFVAYGRRIDAEPDIWLCVSQGTVEVSLPAADRSVFVKEGTGITIVGGEKLTVPRPYPWTRKLNWNMDPGGGTLVDTTNLEQAYADLLDQDYD
jgi:ferric-dicitrate binding protein FerR (iron transport regulator)